MPYILYTLDTQSKLIVYCLLSTSECLFLNKVYTN